MEISEENGLFLFPPTSRSLNETDLSLDCCSSLFRRRIEPIPSSELGTDDQFRFHGHMLANRLPPPPLHSSDFDPGGTTQG